MINNVINEERLKAAAKMVDVNHSVEYCAGMFTIPVDTLQQYLKDVVICLAEDDIEPPILDINVVAPVAADTPLRACPFPSGGHLSTGGVQGHSAGDIFPYVIVLKGNFTDGFKYYIMGNGSHWEYDDYDHAYKEALGWLEFDAIDTFLTSRKAS